MWILCLYVYICYSELFPLTPNACVLHRLVATSCPPLLPRKYMALLFPAFFAMTAASSSTQTEPPSPLSLPRVLKRATWSWLVHPQQMRMTTAAEAT